MRPIQTVGFEIQLSMKVEGESQKLDNLYFLSVGSKMCWNVPVKTAINWWSFPLSNIRQLVAVALILVSLPAKSATDIQHIPLLSISLFLCDLLPTLMALKAAWFIGQDARKELFDLAECSMVSPHNHFVCGGRPGTEEKMWESEWVVVGHSRGTRTFLLN